MKVTREEGFKPVTITLETQEEVNIMAALYGVNGSVATAVIRDTMRSGLTRQKICDFLSEVGREGVNKASNNNEWK